MAGTKAVPQDPNVKPFLPPCRVCGDKAAGFHYGVNTCEACKGFFHRSLKRYTEYKCRANRSSGFCEYRPGKRKSCQYCRFQRCVNAGMSKEAIKTGRYTYLKRTEDTQEIIRLQDMQNDISLEKDHGATLVSSSSNPMSAKEDRPEHAKNDLPSLMEVDSTTADEYNIPSVQGSDVSCSSIDFSSPEAPSPSIFIADKTKTKKTSKLPKGSCQKDNQIKYKTLGIQSTKEKLSDCSESQIDSQILNTQQFSVHSTLSSLSPDSSVGQENSLNLICSSEVRQSSGGQDSSLISCNLTDILDQRKILGKSTESGNISSSDSLKKSTTSCLEFGGGHKRGLRSSFLPKSNFPTTMEEFSLPMVNFTDICIDKTISLSRSLDVKKTQQMDNKDVACPGIDLFTDISFCLDGQPMSRPSSQASNSIQLPPICAESGQLSSLTSQNPESSNFNPASISESVVLNLDNGNCLKVGDDCNMEAGLCQIPQYVYPIQDQNLRHDTDDNVTLQIMEEYTQGLDVIIASPTSMQTPTPVQTLLTSPSPRNLMSVSPLSTSCSDMDSVSEASPALKLVKKVKNLQLSDIEELFSDKDAIIKMLVDSHKENIGDFNYMSKEEMTKQQKEHYEACQLKKQTFGDLGYLSDQEYDEIYSVTGIDIDNRRLIIQKYLSRVERCVRGLVHFAKAIPGFSMLDISTQVELIKLARSEVAIYAVYPTVNLELGVTLGLSGEQWACQYEMGRTGFHLAITEYMNFCDRLQKIAPTQEEEVLLKAILVVSTDRDSSVRSPLAEAIQWQLILCLIHSLEKHRKQPSLYLARFILALTQSRTVAEKFKDFLRDLKMQKYSSIEQNPLLWELYSGILQEKEREANWDTLCQHIGQGKAGMWSPCLLGFHDAS